MRKRQKVEKDYLKLKMKAYYKGQVAAETKDNVCPYQIPILEKFWFLGYQDKMDEIKNA